MIDGLATAVQLVAAGGLLVAAAAKAAAPRPVEETIAALGLPATRVLWAALVTAELTAAVALVAAPGAAATTALVLGLGLTFALVGAIAWRRGDRVACACFGGRTGRTLGLRQVAALPGWCVAALVPASRASVLDGEDGLLALAAVAVGAGVLVAAPVLGAQRRSRGPAVAR